MWGGRRAATPECGVCILNEVVVVPRRRQRRCRRRCHRLERSEFAMQWEQNGRNWVVAFEIMESYAVSHHTVAAVCSKQSGTELEI